MEFVPTILNLVQYVPKAVLWPFHTSHNPINFPTAQKVHSPTALWEILAGLAYILEAGIRILFRIWHYV